MPVLGYDRTIANAAHAAIHPTINQLLRTQCKRSDLAIVLGVRTHNGLFDGVTYFSFGDSSRWEFDFLAIANGKAELTARHNMSSREVQLMHPELIEVGAAGIEGDVKYWGSAIVGNLVVACSGVESYFDEAFAYMIAYMWRAMIQHELDNPDNGRRITRSDFF